MSPDPQQSGCHVGFIVYPGFTALDLVGPYEVLSRLDTDTRCLIVARQAELVASERGLSVHADTSFASCPQLDVLVVPGGPGQSAMMDDEALRDFIRTQAAGARFIAGVCTGVLLLAAAGLLQRRRATTHWLALDELGKYGAIVTRERVVWDEHFITGAGVSAGIDLALELAGAIAGVETAQRIQLAIEYDPRPPFNTGNPRTAPASMVEQLKSKSRFHRSVVPGGPAVLE